MTPADLVRFIGWKWDAFHVGIAAAAAGRLYHAAGGVSGIWQSFTTRGGIVGIVKSLLFGTNSSKS